MDKLKVYHFYNGSGGGVWSVIKNLVRFSQNPAIENHIVHAINTKLYPNYSIEPMQGVVTEQICYYSPNDNFYHTCKKLAACLPNEKALVVAHDWVELGMMSNLGLQNKVVNFLHGDYDYYYQLAQKHVQAVDGFICVAENIFHQLQKIISKKTPAFYHRFPVPEALPVSNKIENSIIFIGRLEKQKGFFLLKEIAELLETRSVKAKWFIVGEGEKGLQWPKNIDVDFTGQLSNPTVQELLTKMEIFILPSLAEGMPVSLIEAMKASVAPVVNNLDGGIKELIDANSSRGFRVKDNNVEMYANYIAKLLTDDLLRKEMQQAAKNYAQENFNPQRNTKIIEDSFLQVASWPSKIKVPQKVYGSRLDQTWIPNSFTKLVRNR